MDGAIYEWNVLACRREKECVLKTCAYTSISLSPDLRSTFAVGTDHTLKEIILAEANVSTTNANVDDDDAVDDDTDSQTDQQW